MARVTFTPAERERGEKRLKKIDVGRILSAKFGCEVAYDQITGEFVLIPYKRSLGYEKYQK